MERTPENAAFAQLLGEEFISEAERRQFQDEVAQLAADAADERRTEIDGSDQSSSSSSR